MSTFTKLNWPVQDIEAVCKEQTVGAGPLTLNGTLFNDSIPNQVSFISVNMIRSVSLSSVNDLSSINFVVSGFQNGAFVTETFGPSGTFPSPNGNTVYGTKAYDIITSVIASAPATLIKVGTGNVGFFPLLFVNPNGVNINYSATILIPSTPVSGINYSILQTLDQISNNFITLQDQLIKFLPWMGMDSQTSSQFKNSTEITNFVLLQINSSSTPITDTFDFIFLQQ